MAPDTHCRHPAPCPVPVLTPAGAPWVGTIPAASTDADLSRHWRNVTSLVWPIDLAGTEPVISGVFSSRSGLSTSSSDIY